MKSYATLASKRYISRHRSVTLRRGISRLDVLAGSAVILLLTSLCLPLLQTVREVARKRTCQANLRRIGTGLTSYNDSYRSLPPAAIWSANGIDVSRFLKVDDTLPLTHENWAICLLPFLDDVRLECTFDPGLPVMSTRNADARLATVPAFCCPADTYNRPDNPYIYQAKDHTEVSFARGNYAINGGSHSINVAPGSLRSPLPDGFHVAFDAKHHAFQWWGIGVAGVNKSFSFDEFTNGLSTTVAVDEVRAGIHPMDPRGTWALGQFGASITWAHGVGGDAVGPNPTLMNSDDIFRGNELHPILGNDQIAEQGMTFCDHCTKNEQAAARSQHPGGVNALMADGSVRFLNDSIHPGVWHLLHSRETPPSILEAVIDNLPGVDDHREAAVLQPANGRNSRTPPAIQNDELLNSIGMRFRRIPAGSFVMGLPDEGNGSNVPQECPAHEVTISRTFYMGVFEVTQQEFAAVMNRNPSCFARGSGGDSELAAADTSRCPVENVTWDEAVEFCRRLGDRVEENASGRAYRLPTEAEWEYCCRSGSTKPLYHIPTWAPDDKSGEFGGKEWTDQPLRITPVGSYSANAFGLFDMRGNVWEWCNDWFARDYYAWSSCIDPQGPQQGFQKVVRGTDWVFTGDKCKTRSLTAAPWQRSPFIGFRVVCGVSRR